MDSRTLSEFVEKAADRADIHGQLHEYGVSRYWSGVSEERHVEVGTNGSSYWVAVGVGLPAMAEDAEIVWAPVDGYDRAKHLEDQPPPPIVGNADFDSFYLLLGPGADSVAHWLSPESCSAFLRYEELHPTLQWFDIIRMTRRLHLRCSPPLWRSNASWYQLGEGPFTSERAARAVEGMVDLATTLEHAQA
jgi:hypothetical protein